MISENSRELIDAELKKYDELAEKHNKYRKLVFNTEKELKNKSEQLEENPSMEISQEVANLERLLKAYQNKEEASQLEYKNFVRSNDGYLRKLGKDVMALETKKLNPMVEEMKQLSDYIVKVIQLSNDITEGIDERERETIEALSDLRKYLDPNSRIYATFPSKPWMPFILNRSQIEGLKTIQEDMDSELEHLEEVKEN